MKYWITTTLVIVGIMVSSVSHVNLIFRKFVSIVRPYRVRSVAGSLNLVASRYWQGEHLRKVMVASDNTEQLSELRTANEVIKEVDYGSFRLLVLSQNSLAEEVPEQIEADDQSQITLNDLVIDTTRPQDLPVDLPYNLRQTNMTDAILWQMKPQGGLFLIQFIGPAKDEWLNDLAVAGVKLCSYVGTYSYVVAADDTSAPNLIRLFKEREYLQFLGDYEPALRLRKALREQIRMSEKSLALIANGRESEFEESAIKVIVQVLDGEAAEVTIDHLKTLSLEPITVTQNLQYHNVWCNLRTSDLALIAGMNAVFAVEEQPQVAAQDERQGRIITRKPGQSLSPGYRSWLTSKGFPVSGTSSIVVNVVDDCSTLYLNGTSPHPDIEPNRIAFQRNPAKRAVNQSGHGFINAHIIAGNGNSNSGDGGGYLYGLGIAPFVQIGVTAIMTDDDELCCSTDKDFGAWDVAAQQAGPVPRVSNNSWGSVINTYNTQYDLMAQKYDSLAFTLGRKKDGLTYVFAAGNYADADQDGQAEGSTISSPGIAKNVITVGASEGYRPDAVSSCGFKEDADNGEDIAFFSGRGHSRSMAPPDCVNREVRNIIRIKPDLVAPGTRIVGGAPPAGIYLDNLFGCDKYYPATSQELYTWSSGTSHAAPAVSGAAALLLYKYSAISPVLIKAWLMNAGTRLSGNGTRDRCTQRSDLTTNTQGMGRLDLERTFDGTPRAYNDLKTTLTQGEVYTITGKVAQKNTPLRVTLAWMDPPAATNTSRYLVNDLDLEVVADGRTYIGNLFNLDLSIDATTKSIRDRANNIESVYLNLPQNTSFTIRVRAVSLNGDGVDGSGSTRRQDFALMVYNVLSASGRNLVSTSTSYTPSTTKREAHSRSLHLATITQKNKHKYMPPIKASYSN